MQNMCLIISLDHPNVILLIGMCHEGQVPLLIKPFMSGGGLLDFVTQNRETLNFSVLKSPVLSMLFVSLL